MDQDLRLVWLYCVIDDAVRLIVGDGRTRSRGTEPELTDAEVLTLQLWGEMEGLASDAAIWRAAVDRWIDWFPTIGSEWNFTRRCANLHPLMDRVLVLLFAPSGDWNAFDGLPLPVCRQARANRDRRFKGEAAWGYCAAKGEHYYGFKAGVSMNSHGEIYRLWLGPANVDEREMVEATAFGMHSLLLADKGLISPVLTDLMLGRGIDLTTPLRRNMKDARPHWVVRQAMRLRRRVETALGVLTEHFAIARTRGRDFWRWSSRILRKILAYNLLHRFEGIAASA
jgi:Transposase DDE domain